MTLADRWPLSGFHEVRDRLLGAYAEPARRYHDLRHLGEVLDRLDELAGGGVGFGSVEVRLAAWFHDAVYDGRAEAEERSALLAEASLESVDAELAAEVGRLVRVTAAHLPAPGDRSAAALVDADLAILASSTERYQEYAAGVRAEYAHLSDAAFAAGRRRVLESLLARPRLFHTPYGLARWEARARANLLAELEAPGAAS